MISLKMLLMAIPFFILALVMHELAHYFVAKIFHVKSRFGFVDLCPAVLHPTNQILNLSIKKYFWITMSPIPFSLIYLFIFMLIANYENYLVYGDFVFWILFAFGFSLLGTIIASSHDIRIFFSFRKFKKKEQEIIKGNNLKVEYINLNKSRVK